MKDSTKVKKKYELSLEEKTKMLRMSVNAVVKGYRTSRLICGTQGIGKSRTILDELEKNDVDYLYISGGIKNARALYQILHDNNKKGLIIVFDDVNNILKNKESIEILRIAVDSNDNMQRLITYTDNKIAKDGNKRYKPQIKFFSKIIIITNIKASKIDAAITSRMAPIEIFPTKKEILQHIKLNLKDAPPRKIPLKWKQEVFDFLVDELTLENIKQIDFRIFEDCCLWYASNVDEKTGIVDEMWKKLVTTLCV